MWEIKEVKEVNVYENNFKANDWFFSFSCNDNFCSMFYGGRSRDTRRSNLHLPIRGDNRAEPKC